MRRNTEFSLRTSAALREALRLLLDRQKTPPAKLANHCGCSPRHISGLLSKSEALQDKGLSRDLAEKIAVFYGLTYNAMLSLGEDLLSGVDPTDALENAKMDTALTDSEVQSGYRAPADSSEAVVPYSEFADIPMAKTRLAAGSGELVYEDGVRDQRYSFRNDWLRRVCNPSGAILFHADGPSMEPTIRDGGIVLVDTTDTIFRDDKVFAIRQGDYVKIKRLRHGPDMQIVISSDNPNKEKFQDELVAEEDLYIIGRAIWQASEL